MNRNRREVIMVFKCMAGMAPTYLISQFVSCGRGSGRSTRQSTQLNIPLLKTVTGQRTFYFRTVKLWNDLCPELMLSMTIGDFAVIRTWSDRSNIVFIFFSVEQVRKIPLCNFVYTKGFEKISKSHRYEI